ncbi:uncharacterized protein LOC143465733 isoform X2 [Clavelina lepadiformis]|uniref:uncharacterized protein LOC143465733 isoform X2 n=1 Tax=Clavelina lepadiformis TaxID=159417 RepID=UPI0040420DD8
MSSDSSSDEEGSSQNPAAPSNVTNHFHIDGSNVQIIDTFQTLQSDDTEDHPPSAKRRRPEISVEDALKIFKEAQKRERGNDLEIPAIKGCEGVQVPVVHPKMSKFNLYEANQHDMRDKYRPSDGKEDTYEKDLSNELKFEDLTKKCPPHEFTAFVGAAGTGKTTLAKRIARSDEFLNIVLCFFLPFMELNYPNEEKLTLQDLLINYFHPDLDESVRSKVFEWVTKNSEKCMIVMDGYDQKNWNLPENCLRGGYKTKFHISQLVANLCGRTFLPKSWLIFTSRPHSMFTLPVPMRPKVTYFLQGLAYKDMKRLFQVFARDEFDKLWRHLKQSSPHMIDLCLNPLMLRFCVEACLEPLKEIGKISSMTRMFCTVLHKIRHSKNSKIDLDKITKQLAKIAFDITKRRVLVINEKQLKDFKIKVEEMQDIMVVFSEINAKDSRMWEGERELYFFHQNLQEYYCAYYIVYMMSLEEFGSFLKEKLFLPHWSMVRKFLAGLLLDTGKAEGGDVGKKRAMYKEKFLKVLDSMGDGSFYNNFTPENDDSDMDPKQQILRKSIIKEPDHKTLLESLDLSKEEDRVSTFGKWTNQAMRGEDLAKTGYFYLGDGDRVQCYKCGGAVRFWKKGDAADEEHRRFFPQCSALKGDNQADDKGPIEASFGKYMLLDLWNDILECNDEEMLKAAAEYFPVETSLSYFPLTASNVYVLCSVLKRVDKHVRQLNLRECKLDSHALNNICKAINEMPGKIDKLHIGVNNFQNNDVSKLCGILSKVEKELDLWFAFAGRCEGNYRNVSDDEKKDLQRALNSLGKTELKVEIEYDQDADPARIYLRKE